MKNTENKLGSVVKSLRLAAGMTQDQLAKQLTAEGFPTRQNTVAKLEGGLRPTSVSELGALARIFNYSPAQLADAVFSEAADEAEGVKKAMRAELAQLHSEIEQMQTVLSMKEQEMMSTRHQLHEHSRRVAILESRLSSQQAGGDVGKHSEEA